MKSNCMLVDIISKQPKLNIALSDAQGLLLSYQELLGEIERASEILRALRLNGFATLMDNSPAHVTIMIAAMNARRWIVPLPPFFSESQRNNALSQSSCPAIFTDVELPNLKLITEFSLAGRTLYLYHTGVSEKNIVVDGTTLITYTSGSTGNPVGICLSEENLLQSSLAVSSAIQTHGINKHLSVLPLSVLLEQTAGVYASLVSGAECVIPSLETTGLKSNLKVNFSNLYQIIETTKAQSCILVPELFKGLIYGSSSEIRKMATLKFIAVGGAKLGTDILLKACSLNIPVFEGYGLTEAGSVVSLNLPCNNKVGSVGQVLPHQELMLSKEGEIYLKKPSFLGYCGSEARPSAPYPTGDLGHFDTEGYLHISGRKKNVLITSMGRNVSPEWIESLLTSSEFIHQAFVHGDGEQSIQVLLVSEHTDVRIQETINKINSTLPDYAHINVWQRVDVFTQHNGTLTGNGKLRRRSISDMYFPIRKQA